MKVDGVFPGPDAKPLGLGPAKAKGCLPGRSWGLPISGEGRLTAGILAIDRQPCPLLILQAATLILEGK